MKKIILSSLITTVLLFSGTASGFTWFLAAAGFIVLDENRQVIEFKSIDPAHASDHGVTEAEIDIYNSELPIINLVVDEFSKLYGNEVMTPEEATAALKEVATAVGLSEECQVALSRIVNHQFKSG